MSKAISQTNQLPITNFNHLRMWWLALVEAVSVYQQSWARYDVTYRELSALSNRDLADIGIPRSSIAKLAKDEAMKVGIK
tara:strand:- start:281 stop:520 length:240 start_codon:yes stop_codon:yes gene_type:complete